MAKPKLTPWFPPGVDPVHVGEYNASVWPIRSTQVKRWWDGECWSHSYRDTYDEKYKQACRKIKRRDNIRMEWRGLAEQPKEQKK